MRHFIIFDLEATCGPKYENIRNEIIEIGAVKLNQKLEIVDEFCEFVKPIIYPTLTKFCTDLTSIVQKDVDGAELFPVVCRKFQQWIDEDYLLISWGGYDKKQLILDCELHNLDKYWVEDHLDLKSRYANIRGIQKCGMVQALKREELVLEGTHHRGIDDAKNIAKIFVKNFSILRVK